MCDLFSIKMRASAEEKHISGAERIVSREQLEPVIRELVSRALQHGKGEPDFVNLKLERISAEELLCVDALPVTTIRVQSAQEGRERLAELMRRSGIHRYEEILAMLPETYGMRGAMLLNADTLERLEPDQQRGVRATYMDAADESNAPRVKNHFREALVLATKVANHPNIIGELCISDDPDYVTGYFASKDQGYVRITKLKEMGSPDGGRIFLFRGTASDAQSCIRYMQQQKMLVSLKGVNQA